jgi:hypothetical protein
MDPTFQGFQDWVTTIMQVPGADVPSTATLQYAYDEALNLTYLALQCIPSQATSNSIYAQAVYNLGGHYLVEFAQDTPPATYWNDLRNKMGINSFSYGLINAAADQGTSEGSYIPEQIRGMTLMDLQLAKTPWGRAWLAISGQWGAIWGITF